MSDDTFDLKSINQLIEYSFFVPSYQRGYRWDTVQVYSLLNDINEFTPDFQSFYCLQPFVLKQIKEELEEGRQKLLSTVLTKWLIH